MRDRSGAKPRAILLAVVTALFVASVAVAASFSAGVIGVMDGDTIEVLHDGRGEKIRLQGAKD